MTSDTDKRNPVNQYKKYYRKRKAHAEKAKKQKKVAVDAAERAANARGTVPRSIMLSMPQKAEAATALSEASTKLSGA